MARARKSSLLVFLFCVLFGLKNLKAETNNGADTFTFHSSSIAFPLQSSNGVSRSHPIVLNIEDTTPKLLQNVPAEKSVTHATFQKIHASRQFIVALTSLNYVSQRKVIPGGNSMRKSRPILPETEDGKSYMDYCCGLDLYGNFTKSQQYKGELKDGWQYSNLSIADTAANVCSIPQDDLQSATTILEQKVYAERQNITFQGADGVEILSCDSCSNIEDNFHIQNKQKTDLSKQARKPSQHHRTESKA
ncbi:hypothetical protein V2J09_005455 [Rumex salicifolius]